MVAARLIPVGPEGRQRIERYELVAEIASGGMATVFLARLSGMGGFQRFVALKRLHPHLAVETEFVRMFLDEARLAALIHHPNVVPILEVGASDGGYYLVMEYIEGDTLARLMSREATIGSRLPVGIGVRIVLDMLTGLHAAHELRDDAGRPTELVHRDVSPQNVLVGIDGNARIADFGVAHAATRLAGTRVGQLKGKIAYMAPEQAAGREDIDRRADVFASGIVLWEMLAARRLFRAANEALTLSRVVNEPIIAPTRYSVEVDPRISAVCMRALERNVDRRFPTCAEFADELERAATASSSLATARDVAAYMSTALGSELAQQRESVRVWLAESEVIEQSASKARRINPARRGADGLAKGADFSEGTETAVSRWMVPGAGRRRVLLAVGVVLLLGLVGLLIGQLADDQAQPSAATTGSASGTATTLTAAGSSGPNSGALGRDSGAADADGSGRANASSLPVAESESDTKPATGSSHPGARRWGSGSRRSAPADKPKPRQPDLDIANPYR